MRHDPDVRHQLLKLNRELGKAEQTKDVAVLRRLVADDYTGIDPHGMVRSKKDTVARFASAELSITRLDTEDVTIRIFGETGIVTGRSIAEGSFAGQRFTGRFRYTDIWVLREGSWELVASQVMPEENRGE